MKVYDDYVAVIPATEAMQVANLLAKVGMALEGMTIVIPEGEGELFRITGAEIHEAHKSMLTAVHENWLGHGQHDTDKEAFEFYDRPENREPADNSPGIRKEN